MMLNIQNWLEKHQNQRIIVGFSGGLDSVVLLHLLAMARTQYVFDLSAIHVHHNLSQNADKWADFCLDFCENWKIPLTIKYVQVNSEKLGVEAAARAARYAVFREYAGDVLALAHHRDDQVETFFLAALRGSGIRGLAAMAENQFSGSLKIARPLLHFSRHQIEQYAQHNQLTHITDDSNDNPIFLRNWLRHNGLPNIRQRLPHTDQHIIAAIANLQDELALINEITESDYQHIYQNQKFNIFHWRELSPARRRQQLVLFVKKFELGTPRRVSVMNFESILLHHDRAEWTLPQGVAVAYGGVLFALPHDWQNQFAWHKPLAGCLKDIAAHCEITFQPNKMGLPTNIFTQNLTIRATQSGDVLPMKSGNKSVKKLLQEHHIPPFLRADYPVLIDENGTCLAAVGLAVNQRMTVANGVMPVCEKLGRFLIK